MAGRRLGARIQPSPGVHLRAGGKASPARVCPSPGTSKIIGVEAAFGVTRSPVHSAQIRTQGPLIPQPSEGRGWGRGVEVRRDSSPSALVQPLRREGNHARLREICQIQFKLKSSLSSILCAIIKIISQYCEIIETIYFDSDQFLCSLIYIVEMNWCQ